MDLQLNNKYALVCGSTAGIGKATALALANENYDMIEILSECRNVTHHKYKPDNK